MESDEKPLEIALDCSAKGLASPKFLFKSSLPPSAPPLTPRRTSGYATSVMAGMEDYALDLSKPEHYNSMTSIGSGLSLASSKSAKSKSSSSLSGKSSKKKVQQSLSNQEGGASPSLSPQHSQLHPHTAQNTPTPNSGRKMSRSKAAVSNFITRSLRVRRKSKQAAAPAPDESPSVAAFHRQDSNEEREDEKTEEVEEEGYDSLQLTNSLISPRLNIEKKFTLSTVMHIYFTEGKQAQVYKSVLVSERATTVEVIAQALERYNMKCSEPHEYTLYDVVGKWQDVTNHVHPQLRYQNRTLPNILNASPLIQRRTSVEEFVVCYCRELGPDESPYNTQFYLTTQEGFTRRFELRSKYSPSPMSREISHEKSHSVDIMERPDEVTPTPGDVVGERKKPSEERDEFGIFGNTSHRKRARRNRIGNQSVDSADPDTQVSILSSQTPPREAVGPVVSVRENRAGREVNKHDTDIPISLNKSHAPDFSALCSSPDSGVEFNKQTNSSTKSSVSSEQSATLYGDAMAMYPANLNCPFLLSLRLQDPSKEHLVHKLTSNSIELGNWSSTSSQERPAAANSLTERILLHIPNFEGVLCCFCRQPVEEFPSKSPDSLRFSHTLQRTHPGVHISVNGDDITDSATLRHGDIVTIGGTYFFMFVDYSSQSVGSGSNFDWKLLSQRESTGKMSVSVETITERDSSRKTQSLGNTDGEDGAVVGGEKEGSLNHVISPTGARREHERLHGGSGRDSAEKTPLSSTGSSKRPPLHQKSAEKVKSHHQSLAKTRSLPLPKDRKLVFSFRGSEEDVLLNHVVSARATSTGDDYLCKLAPAYILAMCTEYLVMASGPKQLVRFIQKATDRIQEVVWVSH